MMRYHRYAVHAQNSRPTRIGGERATEWVSAWLSSNGFDKFGNYTFGVKEHIIFPEVSFDRADKVRGLDIIVVIKAINKDHAFALLEKMNFPFIKKGDN